MQRFGPPGRGRRQGRDAEIDTLGLEQPLVPRHQYVETVEERSQHERPPAAVARAVGRRTVTDAARNLT